MNVLDSVKVKNIKAVCFVSINIEDFDALQFLKKRLQPESLFIKNAPCLIAGSVQSWYCFFELFKLVSDVWMKMALFVLKVAGVIPRNIEDEVVTVFLNHTVK